MPIDIFGFRLGKRGKAPASMQGTSENKNLKSFVPPDTDDGAAVIEAGGFYGSYVDFNGTIKSDIDLINKYRDMSLHPEIEIAVDDIVNDAIVYDEQKSPVQLILDDLDYSDTIKDKMQTEFEEILKLLKFKDRGYDIFRRWYIDSRIYYHIMIDDNASKKGIQELRSIDPTKIRKIKKIEKKPVGTEMSRFDIVDSVEEFYVYSERDKDPTTTEGIKVAPDSICYVHSGMYDATRRRVFGFLQKAIKPLNQLRMIEDAVVIYRISRAPERRIFYIDVGNLPKNKAEQYLRDIMNRYRNKMVYDASTGEMRDDKKHMSMMEDYWLPRKDGGRGTEISTLDGGQNLGEMDDVEYFKKKLYLSLNVPSSRLEADNGFNMGRSSEITRDELKFFKFIERLRNKFSELFQQLLRVQLVLKGIITEEDWQTISEKIAYRWLKDSHFTELKDGEVMRDRLDMLSQIDDYIGKYYSIEWVRKNILQQSEEDIKTIDSQMQGEDKQGAYGEGEEGD
jgi:hypothetical protein